MTTNNLQAIYSQALTARALQKAQEATEEAARLQEWKTQRDAERLELKTWLFSILPPALVEHIDFSNYSHEKGAYYSSGQNRRGVWLVMDLPESFPVSLNVYRSSGEFRLVGESYAQYDEGADLYYGVPTSAIVKIDEDDPYIAYQHLYNRNYKTWETAVGEALHKWSNCGEYLTAQLEQARAVKPEPETKEAPAMPKTETQQMIAALERIADALESMVSYKIEYGI